MQSGTNLCATVNGTVQSDGMPAIALQPCEFVNAPYLQMFVPMLDGTMISATNGLCLDAVSGTQAPNEQIELYSCSAQPNQLYNFDSASGHLLMSTWGYCVGVC